MNSKDIIWCLNNVSDSLVEEAECGVLPVRSERQLQKEKSGSIFRRPLLVAAIIALLLLLVGCAAYFYRLEQLVLIDHSKDVIATVEAYKQEMQSEETAETVPETTAGPYVAEQVLSLQGYEGSPAYEALQEWLAYEIEYTIQNPDLRFSSEFQRPDAYRSYHCYSQEMVDKVDEICEKYGLHLIGTSLFILDAEGMEEHGLSDVLSEAATPRCFYGHLYQDGSFIASGELELSGDYEKTVQFQMHNIKKDAFYDTPLGLNNISDVVQWNYKTQDGYKALLALNERTGLIFAENEGRFVSIIIGEVPDADMVFSGLPTEKKFLEMVCDCFLFSDYWSE